MFYINSTNFSNSVWMEVKICAWNNNEIVYEKKNEMSLISILNLWVKLNNAMNILSYIPITSCYDFFFEISDLIVRYEW